MRRVFTTSLVLLALVSVFSVSCAGKRKPDNKAQKGVPEAGKLYEHITCLSDPYISYALYLPVASNVSLKGYKTNPFPEKIKTWPVILAFDPHASGSLPVKKYKDLAEAYGYILLGSNNSKNGQTQIETGTILKALMDEIRTNYPIDTSRIYLMGFSGGSRVSSLMAMFHKDIRGVIGCGAGSPGGDHRPVFRFDYFGIVGMGDFNLMEMLQLDAALKDAGTRHFITTFYGPHEWPPSTVMEDAFRWIGFNAMKDGMIPVDQAVIDSFRTKKEAEITRLERQKKFLDAANGLELLISCLDGLSPPGMYINMLQRIRNTEGYQKEAKSIGSCLNREQQEQQILMSSLISKDISWWEMKIKTFQSGTRKGNNTEDSLMNQRILSFLSLFLYGNANAAMNQDDLETSGKIIHLYELSDPANPEPNYLNALLLMRQGDTANSMGQLQKAIDKGFSDKVRIIQQREFQGLGTYRPYFDLLQKMK